MTNLLGKLFCLAAEGSLECTDHINKVQRSDEVLSAKLFLVVSGEIPRRCVNLNKRGHAVTNKSLKTAVCSTNTTTAATIIAIYFC